MEVREGWDVLMFDCATGADREQMELGCHFDYQAQVWVDGHDHAHFEADGTPLMFCGADARTCGVVEDGE